MLIVRKSSLPLVRVPVLGILYHKRGPEILYKQGTEYDRTDFIFYMGMCVCVCVPVCAYVCKGIKGKRP